MGIHTLLLNLYVGYYLLDPDSQENYSWLREGRNDISNYFGDDGIITNIAKGVAFGGIMNGVSEQPTRSSQRSIYDWTELK